MSDWQPTTDGNLLCPDCKYLLKRGSNLEHCRMLDSDTGIRCCRTFTGLSTLDSHRTGNRGIWHGADRFRCMSNEELLAEGFSFNGNRWGRPLSGSAQERLGHNQP